MTYNGFRNSPSITADWSPRSFFIKSHFHSTSKNRRFDLVSLFSRNRFSKNLPTNPIRIQKLKIFHRTFTLIAASKKPYFEVVIDVGFWPLSSGCWWRCCRRRFGFTLYPGSLSPLTIMSTPTVKPECKTMFYVGWEITSILFMKLKIPTYFQFDLLLAF